jgi:hypothetical protein
MLSLAGIGLMGYSMFGMGSPPVTPSDQYPTNQYPTGEYPTGEYPTDEYPTDEYPTSGEQNYSGEYSPETSISGKKTDYSAYFKLFLLIAFILIIAVLIYKYYNRNTSEEDN